jgi:hypothetical protein
MDSYNSSRTRPLFRASQIMWLIVGVIETLLVFRFFFKLFGANPNAGFSALIYDFSYPLVAPFMNVFNVTQVSENVFEWTTLLALFVYWLVAVGIMQIIFMGKAVSTREAAQSLERQEEM